MGVVFGILMWALGGLMVVSGSMKTDIQLGIYNTCLTCSVVILPLARNKTDTNFLMSDLFCGHRWNRSDTLAC